MRTFVFTIYITSILALILIAGFGIGFDIANASNIDTSDKWAWNPVVGWIDFYDSDNGAIVIASRIQRWAVLKTDTDEYIALDCNTIPPSGTNHCGISNFGVINDGDGNLSGWAWSDAYGWISFSGSSPDYGVTIDDAGNWSGWAWNDVIGWISFSGSSPDYKVQSEWTASPPCPTCASGEYLESVTFDTQATGGFIFNSIYWDGSFPANAKVGFQLAVSTSTTSGWEDIDFKGVDGTSSTIYDVSQSGVAIPLIGYYHHAFESGYRYYRYRVYLDQFNAVSEPDLTKLVINWSE